VLLHYVNFTNRSGNAVRIELLQRTIIPRFREKLPLRWIKTAGTVYAKISEKNRLADAAGLWKTGPLRRTQR
jgi:hypothetical protein